MLSRAFLESRIPFFALSQMSHRARISVRWHPLLSPALDDEAVRASQPRRSGALVK